MRSRILRVLELYDTRHVWTVEAIAREMGVSVSSAYRDVQELSRAGFLDPVAGAGYVLGPAFIRYDRLLRTSDPLIAAAAPVMHELLAETTREGTAILCRRYREGVMCVYEERGPQSRARSYYERGVAMPLFIGAASKVILAHLDERTLRRTYLEHRAQIREATGCEDLKSFRAELRGIRNQGYAVTTAELGPGRVGFAAPLLVDGVLAAALSLGGLQAARLDAGARKRYAERVAAAAARISRAISKRGTWVPRGQMKSPAFAGLGGA
jgi:DNA-binding IclR family transcriptional regulator